MKNTYILSDFSVKTDSSELQTKQIQRVLDMCKKDGGTVVVPKGRYITGSLRMWSDTTLYLESGAKIIGSDNCEDYEVFDIPDGVELRTDMEMIPEQYSNRPWKEYRRAIISVYGGKNISVIGEKDSLINGNDCADPNGEEGFRGPHGFMITNVENLKLSGYTVSDCGNFMHQIDNCKNISVKNVLCTGGSDAVHLHQCKNINIENCIFHTGDDCIAGINTENLTVRNCELNTSCNIFRIGGSHILAENCRMYGPGEYPHRKTVVMFKGTDAVKDKKNTLPKEKGRHNLEGVFVHFASRRYPAKETYGDIVFRNCIIENPEFFMWYEPDSAPLQSGTYLKNIMLENVKITGLNKPSAVKPPENEPLTVTVKNVAVLPRENSSDGKLFDKNTVNTKIIQL